MDVALFEQTVQAGLTRLPLPESGPGVTLRAWERRTLNSHRGVLYLRRPTPFRSSAEVRDELRRLLAAHFNLRWVWIRGLAYGACVHVPSLPDDAEALEKLVDVYANSKGTLQWLIFVSDDPAVAFGIHTWAEVSLSPTYREATAALQSTGLPCHTFVRDKGAFFQFASKLRRPPLRDFGG